MVEFELVLPCYNEADSLEAVVQRTAIAAQVAGYDSKRFQLVLVQNGSSDHSAQVLCALAQSKWGEWFRVVDIKRNQGYGAGIWAGLQTTTAPTVGWSHADQQCDPADAFRATLALQKAKDPQKTLVKGKRYGRKWTEVVFSRFFETCVWAVLGHRLFEVNAQPKVFPRALLAALSSAPQDFSFDLYVLTCALRAGFQTVAIPVHFAPRTCGVSHWASSFQSRLRTISKTLLYLRTLR